MIRCAEDTSWQGIRCITGHVPRHYFDWTKDGLLPFTVLRDPVQRVFSLYRFMLAQPEVERERLDMPPGCSFEEFIGAQHPELYSQINNGICRLLCGDSELSNPDSTLFWQSNDSSGTLHAAISFLQNCAFGLADCMSHTNMMLESALRLPFVLDQRRENTTVDLGFERDENLIRRVREMNRIDIKLYSWAQHEFARRVTLIQSGADNILASLKASPIEFLRPGIGEICIADAPARQGFHEFEPEADLAWIVAGPAARIYLLSESAANSRIAFRVHCLMDDYPVAQVNILFNGQWFRPNAVRCGPRDYLLAIDELPFEVGLNILSIHQGITFPVVDVYPGSPDKRRLGIAVRSIVC